MTTTSSASSGRSPRTGRCSCPSTTTASADGTGGSRIGSASPGSSICASGEAEREGCKEEDAKDAGGGVDDELDGTPDVRAGRADRCHSLFGRRAQRGDVRPGLHQLLGHLLRRTGGALGPGSGG